VFCDLSDIHYASYASAVGIIIFITRVYGFFIVDDHVCSVSDGIVDVACVECFFAV